MDTPPIHARRLLRHHSSLPTTLIPDTTPPPPPPAPPPAPLESRRQTLTPTRRRRADTCFMADPLPIAQCRDRMPTSVLAGDMILHTLTTSFLDSLCYAACLVRRGDLHVVYANPMAFEVFEMKSVVTLLDLFPSWCSPVQKRRGVQVELEEVAEEVAEEAEEEEKIKVLLEGKRRELEGKQLQHQILQTTRRKGTEEPAWVEVWVSHVGQALSQSLMPSSCDSDCLLVTLRPLTAHELLGRQSRYQTEFKELGLLGKGAFGSVYRALNKIDGQEYAIKKVQLRNWSEEGVGLDDRLVQEVKTFARLSNHPNVIRYYAAWTEQQQQQHESAHTTTWAHHPYRTSTPHPAMKSFPHSLEPPSTTLMNFGKPSTTSISNSLPLPYSSSSSLHPEQPLGMPLLHLQEPLDLPFDMDPVSSEAEHEISFSYDGPTLTNESLTPGCHSFDQLDDAWDSPFEQTEAAPAMHAMQPSSRLTTTSKPILPSARSQSHLAPSRHALKHGTPTDQPKQHAPSVVLYIQMQLCLCSDLRNWLRDRGGTVDPRMNMLIFKQIVQGVQHMHSLQFCHQDIKPENIYIQNEHVYLGDFGLARSLNDQHGYLNEPWTLARGRRHHHEQQEELGTFLYTSPECSPSASQVLGLSSDIYALGVVFVELFQPFSTAMERAVVLTQLRSTQRLPAEMVKMYPEEAAFVTRLLSLDPMHRPTAEDILADPILQKYQHSESFSSSQSTLDHPYEKKPNSPSLQQDERVEALERTVLKLTHQIACLKKELDEKNRVLKVEEEKDLITVGEILKNKEAPKMEESVRPQLGPCLRPGERRKASRMSAPTIVVALSSEQVSAAPRSFSPVRSLSSLSIK